MKWEQFWKRQNGLSLIVVDRPCFELKPLQQNNDHPHIISQIRIFRPTFEKTLDCPSSIWVNNSYTIFETFLHKLVTGNYPILWQFTHPWVPIYRDIHLSDVVWRSIKILWEIWLLRTRLPKGRIDKLQSPLPAVGRPRIDKSKKTEWHTGLFTTKLMSGNTLKHSVKEPICPIRV